MQHENSIFAICNPTMLQTIEKVGLRYIDHALSAKTDNRPDFQQMIKDSEKRLFDIVLVWKLDRFARNRYDSAHYEYQLERNHVKLVSATEPISDSPAGIMVKSMLTGMAEYYSAELSEKVVRGMIENVLKGKYNGGTIPIGFKVDEEKFFQIDPLKAPVVVEAFQRYNDGATMKELMNWLNDSGVTTNRNQKFTYNSVQKLLTNKRYIGENHFKDIVMPDSIPAIVDKDLFEEAQLKIKKNSRAPARHKAEDDYLLTTKLFCGMCGAMMFGECGTGRNKVVHHYYKCATAKRFKTCKKKTVRKEWLEDLVVAETMKLIQDAVAEDGAKTAQWAVFSSAARAIHPRPPRTPISEPGTGVSVLSAMQKGCKGRFEQYRFILSPTDIASAPDLWYHTGNQNDTDGGLFP